MKIMWIGIKITEKQFKKMEIVGKKNKGEISIALPALEGALFMDRVIKFNDLVYGGISYDDVTLLFKRKI